MLERKLVIHAIAQKWNISELCIGNHHWNKMSQCINVLRLNTYIYLHVCMSTSSAVVAIWYKCIYTSVLMHKASLNIKYKLTSLWRCDSAVLEFQLPGLTFEVTTEALSPGVATPLIQSELGKLLWKCNILHFT